MRKENGPDGRAAAADFGRPAVYRYGWGWRAAFAVAAICFGAMCVAMSGSLWHNYAAGKSDLETMLLLGTLGGVVLLALTAMFVLAYLTKLTLSADAIALQNGPFKRSIPRGDIVGWRPLQQKRGLLLVCAKGKPMNIPAELKLDDRFAAWVGDKPNLDEQERQALLKQVQADTSLGADVQQRTAKLAQAQRIDKAMSWLGLLLPMWLMIFPRPYELAIGANIAWPWICIVVALTHRGVMQFDGKQNDPRPSVGKHMFLPSMVLVLRAILDVEVLHPWQAIGWGVVAGLPLFLVMMRSMAAAGSFKSRLISGAGMLIFASLYGGGTLTLLNSLLDHHAPRISAVVATGKQVSTGKSTTYYVEVSGWPGYGQGHRFSVSGDDYNAVHQGDHLCVREHPGALGLAWMELTSCPDEPAGDS